MCDGIGQTIHPAPNNYEYNTITALWARVLAVPDSSLPRISENLDF